MARIGVVVRPGVEEATQLAHQLINWAGERGHECILEDETAGVLGISGGTHYPRKELVSKADPIVTLGGDGTLISVARYAGPTGPTIVGVNFGNLGFLTEVLPSELFPTMEKVLDGTAILARRNMLSAEVFRDGKSVFSSEGLNDAVIQKDAHSRLVDIDVAVNGEAVMRLRADGLIVATPTGSTAYSLASGGSIVYPSLAVFLLTPICAHSLTVRPLVLDFDSELSMTVPHYEGGLFLTVDGQVSERILPGDRIVVSKGKNKVRFVRSPTKSYFEILRTKLNWGLGNKAD